VRQIVEHGGTVQAESAGVGRRDLYRLPLLRTEEKHWLNPYLIASLSALKCSGVGG